MSEAKRQRKMIEAGRKEQERLRILRETPSDQKPEFIPAKKKDRGKRKRHRKQKQNLPRSSQWFNDPGDTPREPVDNQY